jgi:c-di-GMP-binding flagellar brake protein YcgR
LKLFIMKETTVAVNDLLQVKVTDDPNSLTYRSRVEDVGGGIIIMSWPTDGGGLIPVRVGQPLSLSFVREDAAYSFEGLVQDREKEPIPYLKIRPLGPPLRVQRRQFFRVKVAIDVEITPIVVPDVTGKLARSGVVRTFTYDISGSGFAIRSESTWPAGALFDAKLMLPGDEVPIKLLAKVVNVEPLVGADKRPKFHVGMFFVTLAESDRNRIVRHLFKVQMQQIAVSQ